MTRCPQRHVAAVLASATLIILTGCESNGGLRVAGVGEYSLGSVAEEPEFLSAEAPVGTEPATRLAALGPDLLGTSNQVVLARAGNIGFGTTPIQGGGAPDGAAALFRTALVSGVAPNRPGPAAGIVSSVVAPVTTGVIGTVATATAPLAPLTGPTLEIPSAAAGITNTAASAVTETVSTAVASVGGVVATVPATVAAASSAVASVAAPVTSITDTAAGAITGTVGVVLASVEGVVPAAPAAAPVPAPPVQAIVSNIVQAPRPVVSAVVTPVANTAGALLRLGR